MKSSLPDAINEAVARCRDASGEQYELPNDFQLYPVLKVDAAGRCVGVQFWLARIGGHFGRGSTPTWAVGALCHSHGNKGSR